jgi:hypothetical protein
MKRIVALVAAAVLVAGCGSSQKNAQPSKKSNSPAARFSSRVDNPWFPLLSGMRWEYRGIKDGEPSRDVVAVTGATKLIDGVRCTAVSDRLYINGHLGERTTDWYAQDASGTVWYFGEDTVELNAKGKVTSREGTWQAGRDGALAGVFMPAHPRVGQSFRQEYFKGHAEDHFQVVTLAASVQTPAASSSQAILTKEWTPLEPGVLDHKLYVRGIGTVKEQTVKGGKELNVLVDFRRG